MENALRVKVFLILFTDICWPWKVLQIFNIVYIFSTTMIEEVIQHLLLNDQLSHNALIIIHILCIIDSGTELSLSVVDSCDSL